MDVLLAAIAGIAGLAACYAVVVALSFRARIEQLEVERPKFLAEMNGLLDACGEQLDRADAKRKRAENLDRKNTRNPNGHDAPPPPQRRGTVLEPLG